MKQTDCHTFVCSSSGTEALLGKTTAIKPIVFLPIHTFKMQLETEEVPPPSPLPAAEVCTLGE